MMIRCLLLISLLIYASSAKKHELVVDESTTVDEAPVKKWLTLNGEEPLVVARGGFSGLFPESSAFANDMANQLKSSEVALLCNLQMTKENNAICLSGVTMDNNTNIAKSFPKGRKSYNVNGQEVNGWFSVDYNYDDIRTIVSLTQNELARPTGFDTLLPISTVEDVLGIKPSVFWLNVEYEAFYAERNLSVTKFIETLNSRRAVVNVVSSPEIGFLKNLNLSPKIKNTRTKLIFKFLGQHVVEPTTKKTYGEILKDLAGIKQFASGIIVPKGYIWPVQANLYLGNATTLVSDAHKLGLEVYASGFSNDYLTSYNYSYDPTNEYLKFIDNNQFSVDGLITDFSPTASTSIACFATNGTLPPKKVTGNILVITHNGASGVYPGCTDLAYEQAIKDGTDIIDCSVQMSKDGVAFCLDTVDLSGGTTALLDFMSRSSSAPEIQSKNGVFSFDLTWTEIQTLKPEMQNPYEQQSLKRNPVAKNMGKFLTLSEFLEFAKTKAVRGILINIQNAAYLASKKGLNIVDTVTKALSNASFDKQQTQQVYIQSDDSSVLAKFRGIPTYKRMFNIVKKIGEVPKLAADEVKKHADGVVVNRPSVITAAYGYATNVTKVVSEMKDANLTVFISGFTNEFTSFPFDFFADPMVELATYHYNLDFDGIITDFPRTASKYLESSCSAIGGYRTVFPITPGELIQQVLDMQGELDSEGVDLLSEAPAVPPNPPLEMEDVVDPPLPPVVDVSSLSSSSSKTAPGSTGAPAPSSPSSGPTIIANFGLCIASSIMALTFLSLRH